MGHTIHDDAIGRGDETTSSMERAIATALDELQARIEARAGVDVLARARRIRLLALDVDGVMTDGGLIHGARGEQYKRFIARDGLGLKMLRGSGMTLAVVTGRNSAVVAERAEEIDAAYLFQGQHDKRLAFDRICEASGLAPEQIAFMGDDLIDLPAMRPAGLALTVADAHPLVLAASHYRCDHAGGHGAVREVCELLLQAGNEMANAFALYLGTPADGRSGAA